MPASVRWIATSLGVLPSLFCTLILTITIPTSDCKCAVNLSALYSPRAHTGRPDPHLPCNARRRSTSTSCRQECTAAAAFRSHLLPRSPTPPTGAVTFRAKLFRIELHSPTENPHFSSVKLHTPFEPGDEPDAVLPRYWKPWFRRRGARCQPGCSVCEGGICSDAVHP